MVKKEVELQILQNDFQSPLKTPEISSSSKINPTVNYGGKFVNSYCKQLLSGHELMNFNCYCNKLITCRCSWKSIACTIYLPLLSSVLYLNKCLHGTDLIFKYVVRCCQIQKCFDHFIPDCQTG